MAKCKKHKTATKILIKLADDCWRDQIVACGRCAVCGAETGLQAHHLIGRNRSRFRHDLDNGLCLCQGHHMYGAWTENHGVIAAHGNLDVTDAFMDWFKDKRPEGHKWFIKHRDDRTTYKADYQATYDRLLETAAPDWGGN